MLVDNQPPTGSVVINGGAAATSNLAVNLTLSATDTISTVTQMRFSNDGTAYSAAEAYATTKAWTLSTGGGTKTVYVQFRDAEGNWSAAFTDTIVYDATAPSIPANLVATAASSTQVNLSWNVLLRCCVLKDKDGIRKSLLQPVPMSNETISS